MNSILLDELSEQDNNQEQYQCNLRHKNMPESKQETNRKSHREVDLLLFHSKDN